MWGQPARPRVRSRTPSVSARLAGRRPGSRPDRGSRPSRAPADTPPGSSGAGIASRPSRSRHRDRSPPRFDPVRAARQFVRWLWPSNHPGDDRAGRRHRRSRARAAPRAARVLLAVGRTDPGDPIALDQHARSVPEAIAPGRRRGPQARYRTRRGRSSVPRPRETSTGYDSTDDHSARDRRPARGSALLDGPVAAPPARGGFSAAIAPGSAVDVWIKREDLLPLAFGGKQAPETWSSSSARRFAEGRGTP